MVRRRPSTRGGPTYRSLMALKAGSGKLLGPWISSRMKGKAKTPAAPTAALRAVYMGENVMKGSSFKTSGSFTLSSVFPTPPEQSLELEAKVKKVNTGRRKTEG